MEENTNVIDPEEEREARSGKIFFLVFGLILATSVFATYYRTIIQKDYVIESQIDCDPTEQACFVWKCNPESTVEGEACTGDPEKDVWYYAVAKRNASNIPLCDPATDETCLPMLCDTTTEKDCEEIFCNEENKLEQEAECNDPQEYLLENPIEEEADEEIECAEGDNECEAQKTEAECDPGDSECQNTSNQTETAPENAVTSE